MYFDKPKEECAVFGISLKEKTAEIAGITYNALLALQHRGQEGAGIAVLDNNHINYYKNRGLVSEVFSVERLNDFPESNSAIGHCRYSTTGNNSKSNVQPFITEFLTGRIGVAHNGNIINSSEIRDFLISNGVNFIASSDSEVVSSLIAFEIIHCGDYTKGIIRACSQLKGAFSIVLVTSENKIIAVRDPRGFKPLCIGKNEDGYAVASESCALDSCGFDFIRDVEPGEIIILENGEITSSEVCLFSEIKSHCLFEFVYFARPDSVLNGQSVYKARYRMGEILAREHPVDADVVCGAPDSGLDAAVGYASASGIPSKLGFIKNRYIFRSFIYPSQKQRENAVRLKLNPLRTNVEGKRVVLVDDSIVRGTTSAPVVRALRNAGAKEVHMRVSSPPFRNSCYFGIDIGDKSNLIANHMTVEEIAKVIGVDSLGYLSLDGLREACSDCNIDFCDGCFTGDYKMDVGEYSKQQFE